MEGRSRAVERTPEATGSLIDQSVVPRRDGFTLPTGYVAAAVIVLSRAEQQQLPQSLALLFSTFSSTKLFKVSFGCCCWQ